LKIATISNIRLEVLPASSNTVLRYADAAKIPLIKVANTSTNLGVFGKLTGMFELSKGGYFGQMWDGPQIK